MAILVLQTLLEGNKISEKLEQRNKAWCDKYSYDYKPIYLSEERSPDNLWKHVEAVSEELNKGDYDYILRLDNRCCIWHDCFNVIDDLLPLLAGSDIIFTADIGSENKRWNPNLPNDSQYLVRYTDTSKEIFNKWLAAKDGDVRHPATQRKLWNSIFKQYKNSIKLLHDYYLFSAISGYFIRNWYDSNEAVIYEQLGLFEEVAFKGKDDDSTISDIISEEVAMSAESAVEEAPKAKKSRKKKVVE